MAGFSSRNKGGEAIPSFFKPSLPLKMGYALENVLMLLKNHGLREKDRSKIENAENLIALYSSEWGRRMSCTSLRTMADNKFNKKEFLLVTEDLIKLKKFCQEKSARLMIQLEKSPNVQDWGSLAEIVITRLTIFNKHRGNEALSILLSRYQKWKEQPKTLHDDDRNSMTSIEKKMIRR